MQIDFDKINADSLIQIGLIIVFIIQTGYLVRQTNFGVRSSQANLTETWNTKLTSLNYELLWPSDPKIPDFGEFEKLLTIMNQMHPKFKEKLLKSSDFSAFFLILFHITSYEEIRKSSIFKENYLNLQNIFADFNKDIDVIMYLFNLPSTSMYEKMFQEINLIKRNEKLKKVVLSNWTNTQIGFKIASWWYVKVQRKPFFELKPPI